MMKNLANIIYILVLGFLVIVAGFSSLSVIRFPSDIQVYNVVSGSMAPAIKLHSLVIVRPELSYGVGQIITFLIKPGADLKNPRNIITHRIVSGTRGADGSLQFTTRGDANNTNDLDPVSEKLILGRVVTIIPLVGILINYAKTQNGLIFLIVIPATIIIWTELMNIKNETKKLLQARKKRKLTPLEQAELALGQEEIKLQKETQSLYKRIISIFKKKP